MDLNLEQQDGFSVLEARTRRKLAQQVIVLSAYNDPKFVQKSIRLGAAGYMLKKCPPNQLLEGMRCVLNGEQYIGEGVRVQNGAGIYPSKQGLHDGFAKKHRLTKRETEVLQLIAAALSNKEIAEQLFISDQTVGVHRKNIMRKLGVNNIAELMRAAIYHQFDVQ